eukprot:1848854-Pyramimonas_sp.AAC.1
MRAEGGFRELPGRPKRPPRYSKAAREVPRVPRGAPREASRCVRDTRPDPANIFDTRELQE